MKILYFIYGLNIGGAETFIYNLLSVWNVDNYAIDFVLQSKNNANKKLLALCKQKSCKIMTIASFHRNPFQCAVQLIRILKTGEYNAMHIHANALINMIPVWVASHARVPIIIHSHNTRNNGAGRAGMFLHLIHRFFVSYMKVYRIACGREAGQWMFGNKEFIVVNNAIRIEDYAFSEEKRERIRDKYRIKDNFLIGHIGRFVEAKNHEFIMKCFYEIHKRLPNAKMMFVGDGELKKQIMEKCEKYKLEDFVIFAGVVQNPSSYYSAFDSMLFPSIHEGLPFTLVEAQAAGLPVLASDCVTKDVDVTGLVSFLSLDLGEKEWAKRFMLDIEIWNKYDRNSWSMDGSIYDVNNERKKLEEIYDSIGTLQDSIPKKGRVKK